MSEYWVPYEASESEFVEKRSRFISHLWRVESEAEARARIEEMKKKYYDARHNCWCYLLREGGAVRYSDDGEPQGTAGQLCGDSVLRRHPAGSRGADPGLHQGRPGRPVRSWLRCHGPLDAVGRALHLSPL